MYKALMAAFFLFLMPISAAYADFYSWTDKNGFDHATDDISKVPEEYRTQALSHKAVDEEPAPAPNMGKGPAAPAYKEKAMKRPSSASDHTDVNGNGEAYWHERAEELRGRIARLQDEYEYTDQQLQVCERSHRIDVRGKGTDCPGMYEPRKQRIRQSLERARKALEVDLPDEARKLGAYPGWLR